MANMQKSNLRLKKVHERLCRKVYPSDPNKRKLVKLNELHASYEKWSGFIWKTIYDNGFRPGIDNTNPKFFAQFDELKHVDELRSKVLRKIERLETKSGVTLEEANHSMMLANKGRLNTSY